MTVSGPIHSARAQAVLETAKIALERFLAVNPSHRDRAFIRVRYEGSRYTARYGYTSNQGTSTVGAAREQ